MRRSHQPWTAPLDVQEAANCVIGVNYPIQIVNLTAVSQRNGEAMKDYRNSLLVDTSTVNEGWSQSHCRPSNEEEIRQFFWLCSLADMQID